MIARLAFSAAYEAAARRKSLSAAAFLVLAAVSSVSWNALVSQTKPHPYPMFGSRRAEQPKATEIASALPVPPPRLAERLPIDNVSVTPPTRASAAIDPIADMLRAPETGSLKAADDQKAIAVAQRNLTRLGYGPLKSDGALGQGTRAALERFERENRLPVTGTLAPRTARALASKAGA